ncbi:MAG: GGDEF domain-containing protein [Betaproteobacteria bacterium]|nr:MAG: GGDEF domain-containing protein [Betaproteobacteria bacterium]
MGACLATARTDTPDPDGDAGEAVLSAYRDRIFYRLAIVAVILLPPFVVNAFLQKQFGIAFASLALVAVFAVDVIAIRRGAKPPVAPVVLIIPVALAVGVTIMRQGVIGALWAYPAVMLFQFVASRWVANMLNGLLVIMVTVLAYQYLGVSITIRVLVTLVLTMIFTNIFLGIVLRLQERLRKLGITDALTGVYNRRQMDRAVGEAVERHKRYGASSSLLLIDIDYFKRVNDEFGHAAGDRVLRELAALMRRSLRKLDLVFRIGGEEFLVLLPDVKRAGAAEAAEKLRREVASADLHPGWKLTVSIGVGQLGPGEAREQWIRRIDRALYAAKDSGRDRVVVADVAGTGSR